MKSEHVRAFVRESQENITDLNNALLTLESDPAERAAMDAVFRTAHTLKGNFAAMGFEGPSRLAHALEDLLDEVRNGRLEITADLMDLAFESVDHIEASLTELESSGQVTLEPEETIETIRSALSGSGVSDDNGTVGSESPIESILDVIDLGPHVDAESGVYHARLHFREGGIPSVDALLTLETLADQFEFMTTHPDRESIEAGEVDDSLDVIVSGVELARTERCLRSLAAVSDVDITDVTGSISAAPSIGRTNDGSVGSDAVGDPTGDDGSVGSRTATGNQIQSVRVDVEQLDDLYGMVEGLVTGRITLRRAIESGDHDAASRSLGDLDKITSGLQDTVMDMRLIPVKQAVDRLPRLVRDLAREEQKRVDFDMTGTDIELDRTILTAISDPLIHIVRNAVDHGIEPPDERESMGKPRVGSISLRAIRDRDHVVIEIRDDGRGLDVETIGRKAIEKGIYTEAALDSMAVEDVFELIFHPGFSTNEEVTDVSGRGVGMDVVSETVSSLDGAVTVDSSVGVGTTVRLRLPLTVAIVKVLFVMVGHREFGVPLKQVDEVGPVTSVETIRGSEVVEHGDDIYRVIDLATSLGVASGTRTDGDMLIRIRPDDRPVALRCRTVTAQEEVVVKPLDGILSGTTGIGGTAVLGEGNIVPILDVTTL